MRGTTGGFYPALDFLLGFNSPTPCGVRRTKAAYCMRTFWLFQFTHPVRGATHNPAHGNRQREFQFTHPVRGATFLCAARPLDFCFNSRTPCGVRPASTVTKFLSSLFQFTHPVRGATGSKRLPFLHFGCFNSRTPCGVRQFSNGQYSFSTTVSIHAPRAGCDAPCLFRPRAQVPFQFTHPVRGATSK